MLIANNRAFIVALLLVSLLSIGIMIPVQLGLIYFCHFVMPAWLSFILAVIVNQALWYLFTRFQR